MWKINRLRMPVLLTIILLLLAACGNQNSKSEILNVSYDPTREFYEKYNEAFLVYWKEKTGQDVHFQRSHGGSGKQGRAVIDGLQADVVTLALAYDIDQIASSRHLLNEDWQTEFEYNSSPYTSTIVFLVRKGNPKNIHDWGDLVKEDVSVITPNPKTSGGARWNYLAAWAYADQEFNGDETKIKQYMKDLFSNVEVLDSGARGATTTFVERKMGDVLISWENEAYLTLEQLGEEEFEIVTPSISILAEPPVAIVDNVVDKKGTRELAEDYISYLYSEEGQEIAAEHFYRPRNEKVLEKYKSQFQPLQLVTIEDFGGWQEAQKIHFADGGTFDNIYQ